MQINSISNLNFDSKVKKARYLSPYMRSSIEAILFKMNSATQKTTNGDHLLTKINTKVHLNHNEATFEDERRLKEILPFDKQMQGFSNLRIGKKTVIDIDNQTGEIIDYVKPVYQPFYFMLKKAERILATIRTNFNLPEVVQKEFLTINDLTPEGQKKIQKFVLKYEKQRLECIIKKLDEISK